MEKTRVGIVGMGRIGRAHLDALFRIPDVSVVGICSTDKPGMRDIAEAYRIAHCTNSLDELISHVDVIHNCTPNAAHDQVNAAAIDAGCHIYAEKPLSNSFEAALSIWRRAGEKGVVHALNHQYRMNAAVQEMRLRRRQMGRAFLVHGRYHQQSGLYETDYGWRMTEGGLSCALSDIGTHVIDLARCVLSADVVRVFANISTIHLVRTKPDGEKIAVHTDDLSSVLVSFADGAQGTFTVSKVSAGHMNDLRLSVDGQHFSMDWEQENPNLLKIGRKGKAGEVWQLSPQTIDAEIAEFAVLPGGHPLGWYDALVASMREFYAAIRGEKASSAMRSATFLDGVHGMAFVEAALESAYAGTWVDMPKIFT